jgi:hypothetical protein
MVNDENQTFSSADIDCTSLANVRLHQESYCEFISHLNKNNSSVRCLCFLCISFLLGLTSSFLSADILSADISKFFTNASFKATETIYEEFVVN